MNHSGRDFIRRLNLICDAVMLFLSYEFSTWLYLHIFVDDQLNMADHPLLSAAFMAAGLICFALFGLYDRKYIRMRTQCRLVGEALIVELLLLIGFFFLNHLDDFSRGVLFVFVVVALGAVCTGRIVLGWLIMHFAPVGKYTRRVLVLGTGKLARDYIKNQRELEAHFLDEYRVINGTLGEDSSFPGYLGGFELLDGMLEGNGVDEVVAALDIEELVHLKEVISSCEKHGTRISIIPFYNDIMPDAPSLEVVGSSKLLNLRSNPLDNVGLATLKRTFDVLTALLLLVVLSPLFLFVALGVKLSSPGPVFFRQERVGLHKRRFVMYKFRSMRMTGTENTGWTTNKDTRKTAFGTFIRKFSIDELPQLFNVVKGDMSLIGPRPEIPYYVEQFKDTVPLYMVKHQVRPGMTGWAQVNGYRGDTSIPKRIEHDVWYIEHWSLRLDMKILLMTAFGGFINKEGRVKSKQ